LIDRSTKSHLYQLLRYIKYPKRRGLFKSLSGRDLRWRSVPRPDSRRSVISVVFDARVSYIHMCVREMHACNRYPIGHETHARLTYATLYRSQSNRVTHLSNEGCTRFHFASFRFVFLVDITVVPPTFIVEWNYSE